VTRVVVLLLTHLLLGLICCVYAATAGSLPFVLPYLPIVPLLALVVSDACLLSIWGVLGSSRFAFRSLGWMFGLGYLETITLWGASDDDFCFLASLSALSVSAVLVVTRRWSGPLRKPQTAAATDQVPGFQFSIQGLLLLTFAVAASIAAVQTAFAWYGRPGHIVELVIWAVGVATTGLCAVWAVMLSARTAARAVVVLLFSIVIGALIAFGFDEGLEAYAYLMLITGLQAAILLVSLQIVRGAGYRLLRQSAPRVAERGG
jgi:hypothetical protein